MESYSSLLSTPPFLSLLLCQSPSHRRGPLLRTGYGAQEAVEQKPQNVLQLCGFKQNPGAPPLGPKSSLATSWSRIVDHPRGIHPHLFIFPDHVPEVVSVQTIKLFYSSVV